MLFLEINRNEYHGKVDLEMTLIPVYSVYYSKCKPSPILKVTTTCPHPPRDLDISFKLIRTSGDDLTSHT